jgi:hypothetical protein
VELIACSEDDLGPFLAQTIYQLNLSSAYLGAKGATKAIESVPEKEIR